MYKNTFVVLAVIALVIFLIVAGPLLIIWAWNTLFGTVHMIDYNFWTWCAALILGAVVGPTVRVKRD